MCDSCISLGTCICSSQFDPPQSLSVSPSVYPENKKRYTCLWCGARSENTVLGKKEKGRGREAGVGYGALPPPLSTILAR